MPGNLNVIIKTMVVLRGLNGILRSKPMPVNSKWVGKPIYFAHSNKYKMYPTWGSEDFGETDWWETKKLKFEPTGKVFYRKNRLTAIFEYELTEV